MCFAFPLGFHGPSERFADWLGPSAIIIVLSLNSIEAVSICFTSKRLPILRKAGEAFSRARFLKEKERSRIDVRSNRGNRDLCGSREE